MNLKRFFFGKQDKSTAATFDLRTGFQIERPNVFIPWDIKQNELRELFEGKELRQVASGYYTSKCTCLGNLSCHLGFHFNLVKSGTLKELEFFRDDYSNPEESFDEFQNHFTSNFGNPSHVSKGSEGYQNFEWRFGNIQILHFVFDRFGPEEHMRIRMLEDDLLHNL